MSKEIKRYDPCVKHWNGSLIMLPSGSAVDLMEDVSGSCVLYADHLAAINELEQRIVALTTQLDRYVDAFDLIRQRADDILKGEE